MSLLELVEVEAEESESCKENSLSNLQKASLTQLEEIAAKLRHFWSNLILAKT
jgi:hypothetical protein